MQGSERVSSAPFRYVSIGRPPATPWGSAEVEPERIDPDYRSERSGGTTDRGGHMLRIQILAGLAVLAAAAPSMARAGPTRYDLRRTPMLWSYARWSAGGKAKATVRAEDKKQDGAAGDHAGAPTDSGR
jgi:hypothetical protein